VFPLQEGTCSLYLFFFVVENFRIEEHPVQGDAVSSYQDQPHTLLNRVSQSPAKRRLSTRYGHEETNGPLIINRLADETIVAIFDFTSRDGLFATLIRAQLVCHRWRRLVRDTPSLWRHLRLTGTGRDRTILQRVAALTMQIPVDITMTGSGSYAHWREMSDLIQQYFQSRGICRLCATLPSTGLLGLLSSWNGSTWYRTLNALELRQVSLIGRPITQANAALGIPIDGFTMDIAPRLTALILDHIAIPWQSPLISGHLRTLEVIGQPQHNLPTLSTLVATLRRCQYLERLRLIDAGPSPDTKFERQSEEPLSAVALPKLHSLTLENPNANYISALLDYLIVPSVTELHLASNIQFLDENFTSLLNSVSDLGEFLRPLPVSLVHRPLLLSDCTKLDRGPLYVRRCRYGIPLLRASTKL
jgi:hypothetical protein